MNGLEVKTYFHATFVSPQLAGASSKHGLWVGGSLSMALPMDCSYALSSYRNDCPERVSVRVACAMCVTMCCMIACVVVQLLRRNVLLLMSLL